ncbi:hypothetical protein FRC00_008814 [Tulasnella sp. 408]|nr:hypothetical protein FRC00_008814 [Tulasnella sp. 408]
MTNESVFRGPDMAPPPDDLTIPQFILDSQHPLRQLRTDKFNKAPWLIEDETGKNYTLEEVRARTFGLANAVAKRWGIGDDDVVCVYSPNNIVPTSISSQFDVDYPTVIWAIHRLGAIASCANPAYTESELQYQIDAVKASLLIVHPACLQIGLAAARASGLSANRVVLMAPPSSSPTASKLVQPTVEELVQEGLSLPLPPAFVEKRLTQGENQRKIAFLSFSSGTTGKPKELIKCRGFQVAPAELEGHLLDHPDVNDVCVVGVQDDYSGEVPLAFVVLTTTASARAGKASKEAEEIKASIRKHVSEVKVRYKWLDGGVEFVDIIPKNPSGKLLVNTILLFCFRQATKGADPQRRFLREKAKEIRARRGPSHEAVASKVRARL